MKFLKSIKTSSGFTLVEMTIAGSILILLATIGIWQFYSFQKKSSLDGVTQEIISSLRLAQNRTLASEGEKSFGVHFQSDRFVVFEGTSYQAGLASNNERLLAGPLFLTDINFNDSPDLIFERLTGNANSGSLTIGLSSDQAQNKTIYVNAQGIVRLQQNAASDANRITDSRHVHLIYSQNTQTAATLALNFSDGVMQNIDYQVNLNPEKTSFSWVGTINVAGADQIIKIHTLSLTPAATIFCVHRDRRYNSKSLSVSLDGQNLVNYSATGSITPGTSVWVSAPEIQ